MAFEYSLVGGGKTLADYMGLNEERALKQAILQAQMAKATNGGDDPAAVKIVNEMQLAAKAAQDPNLDPSARAVAADRYVLLNQVSKSYAIDRGMTPGLPNYSMQPVPQEPTFAGDASAIPRPNKNVPPPLTMADSGVPGIVGAGNPPVGQFFGGSQPSVIPGYAQAAGSIAATKKGMETQAQKNVELGMNPLIARETKEQEAIGKDAGEKGVEYQQRLARMPQLEDTVQRLSALGKLATYTMAGRTRDALMREVGVDVPNSAVARSEYISMVDNEILPLLRETFGAQFTQKEGESLKITLGDPNKSPTEKDAVLRSFIRTKKQTLNTLARDVGSAEPYAATVGALPADKQKRLQELRAKRDAGTLR